MPSARISGGTVEIMMNDLFNAGFKRAIVHFDGSGDSGSIESVDYFNDLDIDETNMSVLYKNALTDERYSYESCSSTWDSANTKWNETWELVHVNANKLIEIIAEEKLEESDIDWYNNDGGFGQVEFHFDSKEIVLEIHQRYTEINSHTFTYDYLGKADVGEDVGEDY